MVRSGVSGVVRPPSEVSVLGADRFRRLSHRSPERVRSGLEPAVNGEGNALGRVPPFTPSPRANATQPEDRATGVRPSPLSSAVAQGTGVALRGGLLALSVRLRGAQLQHSLRNAADESAPPKTVGHCGQTLVMPENTEEGSALSLVGRSKAFGQALEKKSQRRPLAFVVSTHRDRCCNFCSTAGNWLPTGPACCMDGAHCPKCAAHSSWTRCTSSAWGHAGRVCPSSASLSDRGLFGSTVQRKGQQG